MSNLPPRDAERHDSGNLSPELHRRRVLSDVSHLRTHLRPDGSVPAEVEQDMLVEYETALQEAVMPGAVSVTMQEVAERVDEQGRRRKVISWLGKSAVEVAMSGYEFHFSEAALQRVPIEVDEAWHSERTLQPGVAQPFISPKMSPYDAPQQIAEAERLHLDDAIRVGTAVTNSAGRVVARRLESLLVRDVSLDDWTDMLADPNNLFGRAFDVRSARSARTVMELFRDLQLPQSELPEGPVTLVEAVVPYVQDAEARASVTRQLAAFRADQRKYRREASLRSREWLAFDCELARSLECGEATVEVERFIATMQHQWNEADLAVIVAHDSAGSYRMTEELAAVLEEAKRYLLMTRAAVATHNQRVLEQTDEVTGRWLQREVSRLDSLQTAGADPAFVLQQRQLLDRALARQNFGFDGGCAGAQSGSFKSGDAAGGGGEVSGENSEASENWTWKKGVCRVKRCGSPKPTEVGPCNVCKNCQHLFDSGQDPTKGEAAEAASSSEGSPDSFRAAGFAPKADAEASSGSSGGTPEWKFFKLYRSRETPAALSA